MTAPARRPRTIDDVLRRIEHRTGRPPRRSGRGWVGLCPAHADKSPSLGITLSRDGEPRVKCFGGCDWRTVLAVLGIERGDRRAGPPPPPRMFLQTPGPAVADLGRLNDRFRADVRPELLAKFAASLGLSEASLRSLGIGWSRTSDAWAFPMRDALGRLRGFRLRLRDGRKISVKGGHEGIFLPSLLSDRLDGERLTITEGPTDCAALLDIGLVAVGRPSCAGGAAILADLVKRRGPAEVLIVSDNDTPDPESSDPLVRKHGPGRAGAMRLADELRIHARVRIVTPPDGIKDARAWKLAGATRDDIDDAAAHAAVQRVTSTVRSTTSRS